MTVTKKFDMGEFVRTMQDAPSAEPVVERGIDRITAEILQLKQDAGNAILGIGQRLIEAKAMLSHGEWTAWLAEEVEFSERTAQNFMRLSREWSNPQALADLGATKALTLLALPREEREQFLLEHHMVDGEEKTVIDMTSRELERAIRERDDARQAAEAARAEAQTAEECRARMAADMAMLENLHKAAQESETRAREALEQAEAELRALRDRPVEVAVETVADEEAIAKARAEAVREMQAKVDAAEAARKGAEKQRRSAEAALREAKRDNEVNAGILSRAEQAEAELAEVRRQLEEASAGQKLAAVYAAEEVATFHLLFDQTKETVNKLRGVLLKVRSQGNQETAEKLKAALLALSDAVRRCVE